MRLYHKGGSDLLYAPCKCGAIWSAELRHQLYEGRPQCMNCADDRHMRGYCITCRRGALPIEQHHVFTQACSDMIIPVCLNCHAMLSAAQYKWRPAAYDPTHAAFYVVFAWIDIVVLYLQRRQDCQ